MPTPLIIPACDILPKNKEQLERLLLSIESFRDRYTVIICFDSCDEFFVNHFQEKFPWVHSIENLGHRLNFTRNANVGLRFSYTELKSGCFLVNQDCVLPPVFHENIGLIMEADLSTPMSVNVDLEPLPETFLSLTVNERFAFYCPWISYKCIEKIGYLDGVFRKTYSDTDYVLRALLAGLNVTTTNVPIFHEGSHINTAPGWSSASGCYNAGDLTEEFRQFAYKWDVKVPEETLKESGVDKKEKLPIDKLDSLMLKLAQEQFIWTDDMRIN